MVASWLVCSYPDQAVQAGDTVLCSWARHLTLKLPLPTQLYKWVVANLMVGGNHAMDQHPILRGLEILLVTSCYRNRDMLRPDGPRESPKSRHCLDQKEVCFYIAFNNI